MRWGAWGRGMRIATAGVRTGLAMTGGLQGVRWAAGHMGPALQGIFVGQGPCALPGVQHKTGGRTEASAPTDYMEVQQEVQWAGDRKGRPYGGLQEGAAKRAVGDAGPYG